jgi:hypothetical protein
LWSWNKKEQTSEALVIIGESHGAAPLGTVGRAWVMPSGSHIPFRSSIPACSPFFLSFFRKALSMQQTR